MKERNGISLLCCYNDRDEAQKMLLDSIESVATGLPFDFDVRMIDTKAKGYQSAAEAYNREAELNREGLHDILIFCHQDISFPDTKLLCRIYEELTLDSEQIIGVAGMPSEGSPVSNLKYKSDNRYITRRQITDKTPVDTLDECLIAIGKDVFFSMEFDEGMLRHWHLYVVDLCYNARISHGIESYVLPESIYHKCSADNGQQTDDTFLREINRLASKYHSKISVIRTPCYILPTPLVSRWKKLARTWIKHIVGKN